MALNSAGETEYGACATTENLDRGFAGGFESSALTRTHASRTIPAGSTALNPSSS